MILFIDIFAGIVSVLYLVKAIALMFAQFKYRNYEGVLEWIVKEEDVSKRDTSIAIHNIIRYIVYVIMAISWLVIF